MSEPVVFISHFGIKEGTLEDLRRLSEEVIESLRQDKPRTVLYLAYLDDEGTQVSFLHAFHDAESMDLHFEGADERGKGRVPVPRASRVGDLRAAERGNPGVDAAGGGRCRCRVDGPARPPRRVPPAPIGLSRPRTGV